MISLISIKKGFVGLKKRFILVVLVIIIIFVVMPVQKVEIGQKGILYNSFTGQVDKKSVGTGWHILIPFIDKLTVYPINERIYGIFRDENAWLKGQDTSIWIPTSDGKKVNIDIFFKYRINEEKLAYLFQISDGITFEEFERKFLDNEFRKVTISVITKSTMNDVYSNNRTEVENKISKILNETLASRGIVIDSVFIEEARLSPEAEAILTAEAKKEAILVEAEAKSEANKIINNSLTENIIRLQILEKLSSDLKLIVVPESTKGKIDLEGLYNSLINADKDKQSQNQSNQSQIFDKNQISVGN